MGDSDVFGMVKPASSKVTCVAILIFFVMLSLKYMLCSVPVYPRNIPAVVWESSFAGRLPGSLDMTGNPNTRNCAAFGHRLVYAW